MPGSSVAKAGSFSPAFNFGVRAVNGSLTITTNDNDLFIDVGPQDRGSSTTIIHIGSNNQGITRLNPIPVINRALQVRFPHVGLNHPLRSNFQALQDSIKLIPGLSELTSIIRPSFNLASYFTSRGSTTMFRNRSDYIRDSNRYHASLRERVSFVHAFRRETPLMDQYLRGIRLRTTQTPLGPRTSIIANDSPIFLPLQTPVKPRVRKVANDPPMLPPLQLPPNGHPDNLLAAVMAAAENNLQ